MTGTAAGVPELEPGLRNELPVVAGGMEGQL